MTSAISAWQQTESDANPMPIHVSAPDGAGIFPALVVIQHQSGVDEFIHLRANCAKLLASFQDKLGL